MLGIEAALTAEEWKEIFAPFYTPPPIGEGYENDPHRIAALALYGQPFGFTREDVRFLQNLAMMTVAEAAERQVSLIRRIEALLPPEEG